MSWVSDQFDDLLAHILSFFGEIGKIVGQLLKDNFKEAANQLIPFAAQFILAAAKDPSMVTDGSKRDAVLNQLGNQAIALGIQMGMNDLTIIMESTLKLLKGDPAQPLTTDAPPSAVDLPPTNG